MLNSEISMKNHYKWWKLLVSWKGGTSNLIDLKDWKESNPVKVSDCAGLCMVGE